MDNNKELYDRIYEVSLEVFVLFKELLLKEDLEGLEMACLSYLEDLFLGDKEYDESLCIDLLNQFKLDHPIENSFEHNGIVYVKLDLDKLTTAEFIDLESYYKEDNMLKVCSILYRPTVNGVIEEYNGTAKYGFDLNSVAYRLVFGAYLEYTKLRKDFTERFQYLYTKEDPVDAEDRTEDTSYITPTTNEDLFSEEFGWYSMVHTASKEGFLQMSGYSSVFKSPAEEFLMFMNYFKRKSELDAERIRTTANTPLGQI